MIRFPLENQEVRKTRWTKASFDAFMSELHDRAWRDDEFRQAWRISSSFKGIREELYPFRRALPALVGHDVEFGLTEANSPWDIWFKSAAGTDYCQVTLAFRSSLAGREDGHDYHLRMKYLNEHGHCPLTGSVDLDKGTRRVALELRAESRQQILGSFACGISRAIERKRCLSQRSGSLVVFVNDWVGAYSSDDFSSVVYFAVRHSDMSSFERTCIVADRDGCCVVFS